MAEVLSLGPASFSTRANALLRKNLTFQKRNIGTNIRLISFPFLVCLLLVVIQTLVNNEMDKAESKCGCKCTATNADGKCSNKVCGIDYSTLDQVGSCSILTPPEWAPVLQVPDPNANILVTGNNQTFGGSLASNLLPSSFNLNSSDMMESLSSMVLGSPTYPGNSILLEPAFVLNRPLYYIQSQCSPNSTVSLTFQIASTKIQKELTCVQGREVWLNSLSDVIDELYKGFKGGNSGSKINECIAAYDFLNSNEKHFNVTVWYNSSFKDDSDSTALLRVPRSVNLASNAYLRVSKGPGIKVLFDFVKAMPKHDTHDRMDIASIIGTLFFTWVILQLFPVVLTSLVYEKQQNLRIMMKMHGLGDGPYWMISYFYFLLMSSIYMLCFVIFGSVIGLKFFTLNDYTIQLVFYFIYINLQISMAFLVAALFSNVKTATVVAYICVFGTGLLGGFLFQPFIQDTSFPSGWIIVMELYPGFSLYRGLYELAQYSFSGTAMGTDGMRWVDLRDDENGMMKVLIIMFVEWLLVIAVAYHIDQAIFSGRSPLSFLRKIRKKPLSTQNFNLQRQGSGVLVEMDKADVSQEREKVEQLLLEPKSSYAVICDNLKKVYPGKDGNLEKVAVKGLSLALPRGECFGMLGPNGAGKTSFISMMIGLTKPSSGAAFVQGLDIRTDMDRIYTSMGVCPQHDLLWETLTGREHLLFYGRLKNLKGAALTEAVDESLKSVNLFHGKVGDKQAGKYSGGMKRRLSVAISLIGDPKVVYMDEPSTGLDPASRNNLWSVVTCAKKDRAIILTTHSMEEADILCDRLGIFVDGSLECIGNAKELKARYGGSYVFTMTTASNHEMEVENLVRSLSLNANRIYQISGTQKFELPKQDVRIADVFRAVENAKRRFSVHAWGLTDTTLEDVFIKIIGSPVASSDHDIASLFKLVHSDFQYYDITGGCSITQTIALCAKDVDFETASLEPGKRYVTNYHMRRQQKHHA